MTGPPRRAVGLLAVVALLVGCTASATGSAPAGSPAGQGARLSPLASVAERQSTDLGPVGATTPLTLTLGLTLRQPTALETLLDTRGRVTPAAWAAMYGPDPAAIAAVERILRRAGLRSRWQPGDAVMSTSGPARPVESFFRISVHRFDWRHTYSFYAPIGALVVPSSLSPTVDAVTGATNLRPDITAATSTPVGLSPAQVEALYDMTPVRDTGVDGSGLTVVFPEWAMPEEQVLDAYAQRFGLPPFDVTVRTDPPLWGQPDTPSSPASNDYVSQAAEAALDLEVVHGLAPGAHEVVYELGDPTRLATVLQSIVSNNHGSIISSSISDLNCEVDAGARASAESLNAVFAEAAAEGTSVFWASGDTGAYGCVDDGDPSTAGDVSISPDVSSPDVTAVGGTEAVPNVDGGYSQEAAWGEPLEEAGSGGGISTIFPQPAYQQTPGSKPNSQTGRGVPDVSCQADVAVSGWTVFLPPGASTGPAQEAPVGGTSAAAPCWAAITALIDESLARQSLPAVGFVNPALYLFGSDPAGLPAPAFHQVGLGSNLHYLAGGNWNAASGLGSPDVTHLTQDFEWYERRTNPG